MEPIEGLYKYDQKPLCRIFISNMIGKFRDAIKLLMESGIVRNNRHAFYRLQPICNTLNKVMIMNHSYDHMVYNTIDLDPSDQQITDQV